MGYDDEKLGKVPDPKPKKSDKDEGRGAGSKIGQLVAIYRGEFKQITWPTWEKLVKSTFTVILVSLMIGAIIAGMDFFYENGYRLLIGLFL